MSSKPPRLPELLLKRLTPPGEREFLMGDLQERYGDLLAGRGRAVADAWYCLQIVNALVSLPGLWRAQGSGRPRESRSLTRDPTRQTISTVLFNLRVAVRTLRRAPLFSVGIILTLALGVGANATMFGILDRLLLRPPQHLSEPDQIHRVYRLYRQSRSGTFALARDRSYADFVALKQAESLSMVAAYIPATVMTLGSGLDAERVRGVMSSPEFFPLVGVHPRMGRFFDAEEDRAGAPLTAVLGYGYWQRRFGGDPSVLGRTLTYLGATVTVIGVAPEGFTGVDLNPVDIWLPIQPAYALLAGSSTAWRTSYWPQMICRLRPGVSPETAQDEATAIYMASREEAGRVGKYDSDLRILLGSVIEARVPKGAGSVPGTEKPAALRVSQWLAGVSVFVFLIACANVANLLLARATDRRRELAIRLALGVSRTRLVGELSTEALVLATLGGLGALAVVRWGGGLVRNTLLPDVDWSGAGTDSRLLIYTLVTALAAGLAAGVWPAIRAGFSSIMEIMGGGTRGDFRGSSGMSRRLASLQLAVTVILLGGAGLFLRSLVRFQAKDIGMDTDRVAVVGLQFEDRQMTSLEVDHRYRTVAARLAHLPGVSGVALTSVPFGSGRYGTISVPGIDSIPIIPPDPGVFEQFVDEEYFRTLGIRVVEGRSLISEDRAGAAPVLVVSRMMARTLWPGESALGKCVRVGGEGAECSTVVGVVEDAIRSPRQKAAGPAFMQYYLPLPTSSTAATVGARGLYVRMASLDSGILPQLQREAVEAAPGIDIASVRALRAILDREARPWTLGAGMFSLFGLLALVVASVGLYSVLAYSVARRKRELGIRAAVGASKGSLLSLVLRDGFRTAVVGLVIGIGTAVLAGRWMEPLLFDVSPRDPEIWGVAALTLLLLSLVSSLVPAVRACEADPVRAIKSE